MKKIILIFSLVSIMSISYSVEITKQGVLFSYEDGNAQSVFLVGSMNNWNTTATPMEKDENGIWKIILKLDSGKHAHKFMVDGNWYYDGKIAELIILNKTVPDTEIIKLNHYLAQKWSISHNVI